jgi:hypothetical protein
MISFANPRRCANPSNASPRPNEAVNQNSAGQKSAESFGALSTKTRSAAAKGEPFGALSESAVAQKEAKSLANSP